MFPLQALRLKNSIALAEIIELRKQVDALKYHIEHTVYMVSKFQVEYQYKNIVGRDEEIPRAILDNFMTLFGIEVEPKIRQTLIDVIPPPLKLASKSCHNLRIGTSKSVSFR